MKPHSLKILAACLALAAAVPQAHAMDAEALFQQASPSIWVVNAMNAQDKLISAGSAVVIGPGRLVTNCHVLARASSFKLRQGKVTLPGKLEFPDVERDLCQVRVEGMTAPAVSIAPSRNLRVGQKVFTLGAPSALEETISDGLLSALRLDPDGKLRFLQISAPISSGSSGGGLFNDKGELIGITTAMLAGTTLQNLSFAVPADWIWELEARGRAALAARSAAKPSAPIAVAANTASAPAATAAPVPLPVTAPAAATTKAAETPTAPAPVVTPPVAAPSAISSPVAAPPAVAPSVASPIVTPPVVTPPVAAPPITQVAATGWNGLMRCAARHGSEASDAAYQSEFEVQVTNSTVTLRRKNDQVAEALTGRISDGRLDLKGVGYKVEHPEEIWKFRFNGDFQPGPLVYSGKGNMLSGADVIRDCDVTIKRI